MVGTYYHYFCVYVRVCVWLSVLDILLSAIE